MSWRRVRVLGVALAVCSLANSTLAFGSPSKARATSLRISFEPRSFHLTFYLRCNPAAGTLPSPSQACKELARASAMVFPPRETGSARILSCPPPRYRISIQGRYRGRVVDAVFTECGSVPEGERLWLRYLPSLEQLERVQLDRGLGPLHLGESRRLARSVLGPPDERTRGVEVYKLSEEIGVGAQPVVPEIFVVGYGRLGRVTTLIYNGDPVLDDESLSLPPRAGSPVSGWPQVRCGGHGARIDHLAGAAKTIVWSPITAIVTSMTSQACAAAAATAPQPVP